MSTLSNQVWEQLPPRRKSATLIILFKTPIGIQVVLTVRSLRLKSYPGDSALPGGRADPGESWWDTAIREAAEEIGFDSSKFVFTRIGEMPAHVSRNYLLVRPVIAMVEHENGEVVRLDQIAPTINTEEVSCVYSIPLEWFLDEAHLEYFIEDRWLNNLWYFFCFEVPLQDAAVLYAQDHHQTDAKVIGLTAHILVDCARSILGKEPNFPCLEPVGYEVGVQYALDEGLLSNGNAKV